MDNIKTFLKQIAIKIKQSLRIQPLSKNDFIVSLFIFIIASFIGNTIAPERMNNDSGHFRQQTQGWYQYAIFQSAIGLALHGDMYTSPLRGINKDYDRLIKFNIGKEKICQVKLNELASIPTHKEGGWLAHDVPLITYCVAFLWKLTGIASTEILIHLYSAFLGITAVLAYLLFRQVMVMPLAVIACCYYIISEPILFKFMALRDFSRLPGILAATLLFALLQRGPVTFKRYIKLSIIFGIIFALCSGLRRDFYAILPFILASALFLHPGKIFSWRNLARFAVFASILLVGLSVPKFFLPASIYRLDSLWHIMLLGSIQESAYPLLPTHYSTLCVNNDPTAKETVNMAYHAENGTLYSTHPKEFATQKYYDINRHYSLKNYITLPYDIIMRSWYSTYAGLKLSWRGYTKGTFTKNNELHLVHKLSYGISQFMQCQGDWHPMFFIICAAFILLTIFYFRSAFFILLLSIVIPGIYSMQFQFRHFFGCGFIGILLCGITITLLLRIIVINLQYRKKYWKRVFTWEKISKTALKILFTATLFFSFFYGSLYFSKKYQEKNMKNVIEKYNTLNWQNVSFKSENLNGFSQISISDFLQNSTIGESPYFIRFNFDFSGVPDKNTNRMIFINIFNRRRHYYLTPAANYCSIIIPAVKKLTFYKSKNPESVDIPPSWLPCLTSVQIAKMPPMPIYFHMLWIAGQQGEQTKKTEELKKDWR